MWPEGGGEFARDESEQSGLPGTVPADEAGAAGGVCARHALECRGAVGPRE